jgi:hypothetical protein
VIDRLADAEAEPMLWLMPATLDKSIMGLSSDPDTGEVLPLDSPDDGYDITFNKVGQGVSTRYEALQIQRRPSPLHADEKKANQWLDFIVEHPLPSVIHVYDYDRIKEGLQRLSAGGVSANRGSKAAPKLIWADVQAMGEEDLLNLAASLHLDADKADSIEDLKTWICDELMFEWICDEPMLEQVPAKKEEADTSKATALRDRLKAKLAAK